MGVVRGALSYLSGISLFKKQFSYVKSDFVGLADETKGICKKISAKKKRVDDWNTIIINHGLTSAMIMNQYKKRRIIASIFFLTFLVALYFVIVDNRFIIGFPAVFISFILYSNNALRLYQIRQRELCKWGKYLSAVKSSFKEILPLSLPDDWQLMQTNKGMENI